MSEKPTNLKINGQRLWDSLMEMAEIGGTPKGGCNRQTLTDLDREGRDLFTRWAEAAGCTVTVDEMGNMMARRPGRRDDLPPVVMGSHLDTQPTGGKFDGVAGVLCGLEVVRTLNDLGYETDHPLMVVNWTNEEGTRFAPAMMSSGVFGGAFTKEWAYARTDREGKTFGEELERIGYKGELPCAPQDWKCHLELHIEQGPVLEAEDKPIGVVVGGQGIRWYDVRITGKESHAGSTPMPRRKDALVAASKIIARLDAIAREHGPSAVITVGVIDAQPASRNIIPGQVSFSVDMRHPEEAVIEEMDSKLRAAAEEACGPHDMPFEVEQIWYFPPVQFDRKCIEAVRGAAESCGYAHRDMISGPGHDSCYTARVVPTSMIFIPCKDGLSHNEEEWTEPEHVEAGCNVLLRAALTMAQAA
ncbi:Zn-dependent hydrolase [Marinimicrococcus flavescens]|uniref:Zn-dependent hydrolase n=1 Tax=Marinimicrococcus flavescens TaxID=3031815 RepID=A0AAP3UXE5_9PROT|nr:Zn-dependent hydrolase [Marinimicrococcus flavescens]